MTKEDKELIIRDISGRLPYKVKVRVNGHQRILYGLNGDNCVFKTKTNNVWSEDEYNIIEWNVKPYLRSMSSMTEKEKEELSCIAGGFPEETDIYIAYTNISYKLFDNVCSWLNAHYFDYRGLIGQDLALLAKPNMYKI